MSQNSNAIQKPEQEKAIIPAVDIEETTDDVIVSVDMPGIDPQKIDVQLDKDILTVQAKSEIESLEPRLFRRQFRVMRGLDSSKCRADYKLGVLTLRLTKPTTSQPQQIKITCE